MTERPRVSTGGEAGPAGEVPWQKVQVVCQVVPPWHVLQDASAVPWQLLHDAKPAWFTSYPWTLPAE